MAVHYVNKDDVKLQSELTCRQDIIEDEDIVKATKLFRDNLKLAGYVAKRYSKSYDGVIDEEDILQMGYEALWRVCLDYNPLNGAAFSTYAVPWINGYILRSLRECNSLKLPRKAVDVRSALIKYGMTVPLTPEEVQKLMDVTQISRSEIERYSEIVTMSLDEGVKETEGVHLSDMIPDKSVKDLATYLQDDELDRAIEEMLKLIKPNHRDMVEEWVYSVLAEEPLKQQTLANKYHTTQPHVGRILRQAVDIFKVNKEEILKLFGEV